MPRGDKTGPMGDGPMTGRKSGFCAGYDRPGFFGGVGRGLGLGAAFRGGGRGYFWSRRAADLPENTYRQDDMTSLKAEVENLKQSLASILEKLKSFSPDKEK